jgi:Fic family protein
MAHWQNEHWPPNLSSGIPKKQRKGGQYRAYIPDPLASRPIVVDHDLSLLLADTEKEIRLLTTGDCAENLSGLSRFLLRSEAIASSQIEGVVPSARQAALAELGQTEDVRGISDNAKLVARNILIVKEAVGELATADRVTLEHILALHHCLLPEDRNQGLRTSQNWIGRSTWHPLDADFVPPPHDQVIPLMNDLVDYINGATHAPLVQAAIVHAQFETIHPFGDGNGRVGRALIHTVLTRRGLTPNAVLPVSLVLATLSDRYINSLTQYRYTGPSDSNEALDGAAQWLRLFADATRSAVDQAYEFCDEVDALRLAWQDRLVEARRRAGRRGAPRSDSVSARLLQLLPEAPVLTASTVQRILEVSHVAANAGLVELHGSGILTAKKIERGTTAYIADEILELITLTERQFASTQFNTAISEPTRPVPALPVVSNAP